MTPQNTAPKRKAYMEAWRAANKERLAVYQKAYNRAYLEKNRDKVRAKGRRHSRKGLPAPTRAEPAVCECCGRSSVSGRNLALDHCHETNVFRGWLCHCCNTGIGMLGDDIAGLDRARDYLARNKVI